MKRARTSLSLRLQTHGGHRPGERPVGTPAGVLLPRGKPRVELVRVGEQSVVAVAHRSDVGIDDLREQLLEFAVAPAAGPISLLDAANRSWVREGAQQTNSGQQSRNLLISDKAHVDTKPQLEIFADDVKCAHGATVGQIDAEELFYLKSRGLSETAARNLLTYAFAAHVIEGIPVKSLANRLEKTVLEQTHMKGFA